MKLTSERRPQALALGLMVMSLLGALAWFWWSATQRANIAFLPRHSGAEWIAYPCPPEIMNQFCVEMQTVFKRSFTLDQTPTSASLRLAALHAYSLSINGARLTEPSLRGRNWKEPDTFQLTSQLQVGTNEIEVRASNTNGPAALWLRLDAGDFTLASDVAWDVSYAGAAWRKARLAATPRVALPGNPTYGGETPWPALRNCWPMLLLFAALGAAVWLGWGATQPRGSSTTPWFRRIRTENWLVMGLVVLWVALFANNLGVMGYKVGFDITGHLTYISYIQEHHSLPLALEGWETHQPPLYYLLSAALLNLFSLPVFDPKGIALLRILGMGIGIAHFLLVWACLRLLFPADGPIAPRSTLHTLTLSRLFGLLLAAFLPPVLFLAHYVTNEAMAAMLVTSCVYLTIRILKQERTSWKLHVLLGLCLGAALLTKATALLLLPLILVALAWKGLKPPGNQAVRIPRAFFGIVVVSGLCALISGWHYARPWFQHDSLPFAARNAPVGPDWWQNEGYRTAPFYLRFGDVLFHPWYSSMRSFVDGIYSTLWGDGLFSGAIELRYRPPWNYGLMMAGYWLALVPTLVILWGLAVAMIRFIKRPSPEWFVLLGLGFLIIFALVQFSLSLPYYGTVKGFYGLSALVPLSAFGALGWQTICRTASPPAEAKPRLLSSSRKFARSVCSGALMLSVCVWALVSYSSFWIRRSSTPTLLTRGRSLIVQHRYEDAASTLKARLEAEQGRDSASISKGTSDVQCLLASILLSTGNFAEAQPLTESVVGIQPDNAEAHLLLEQILARQQDAQQAIAHGRRAIELNPGSSKPYGELAELLTVQAFYDQVVPVAREGLAVDPANPLLHLALGCALTAERQDDAARAQIKLAFNLKPDWPEGHELLGSALLTLDRPAEAGAHFSEVVRLQPTNALARYKLAASLSAQHKDADAVAQYREALRIEPGFPEALNDLAWIRAANAESQLRDGAEAVRLAEQACQLTDYKEAMLIGTLAAAYAEAGRFQDAASMATKAKELALANGQPEIAKKNTELLELYQAGKPYHEKEP